MAAFRGGSVQQMVAAREEGDGPPGIPHGALWARASAVQAPRCNLGFHTQKIFVSGGMITFPRSKWINQIQMFESE